MSNVDHNAFESVKTAGAIWEPKQTGSKKENNRVKLTAGPNSWMTGWYLETEEREGQDGRKSLVHKFKFHDCGDKSNINGEMENGKVSVWGTGVLNKMIADKIQPGQFVKLVWEGIKQSKKGDDFHSWDVLKHPAMEPYFEGMDTTAPDVEGDDMEDDDFTVQNNAEPETKQAPAKVAETATDDFDDDDF